MQPTPECFPLPLISLLFRVDTEIVSCSYGLKSLGKFGSADFNQLRARRSPKLFAQLIGQKPVSRREFRAESDSFRQGCGALFCSRRFCLSNVGGRYIHSGPLNHIVASWPIPCSHIEEFIDQYYNRQRSPWATLLQKNLDRKPDIQIPRDSFVVPASSSLSAQSVRLPQRCWGRGKMALPFPRPHSRPGQERPNLIKRHVCH